MIRTFNIIKVLLKGSLGNRKPNEVAAFVVESGDALTELQYAVFDYLLRAVLVFALFLAVDEVFRNQLPAQEIFRAASFPGAIYAAICLLAIHLHWIERLTMIRVQLVIFIPLLTIGLATGGGLIDTGILWLMSLPFLAHIYGGPGYLSLVTLGTFLSVGLLGLTHYWPGLITFLPHFEHNLFQSTLIAIFGLLITGIHILLQELKQRRITIVENSLFHLRNSQSTITTVREMAGAVAHQMNTPLSTYYLAIEQVRMLIPPHLNEDPEVQTILQRMDSAIARITHVNRSLLVVTNDAAMSQPADIDLRKAVHTAMEAFRNSSRQERPQITLIDNDFSAKTIAPEGALSQYLWRCFSILEEQLQLGATNTASNELTFRIEITDAGQTVNLELSADLLKKEFAAELSNSLTLLGTHMVGTSAVVVATRAPANHIQILLTFQKAGTTRT